MKLAAHICYGLHAIFIMNSIQNAVQTDQYFIKIVGTELKAFALYMAKHGAEYLYHSKMRILLISLRKWLF